MPFVNTYRPHPGDITTADDFNLLMGLLMHLRGQESGQAEIDSGAPFRVSDSIESTHATALDIRKRYETGEVPEFHLFAEMIGGSSLEDGFYVEASGEIGVTGGSVERYGSIVAERVGLASGKLKIQTLYDTAFSDLGTALCVDEDGNVGAQTEYPKFLLDIPAGALNISGDFYQDGTLLTDWTLTGGTPDKVSKTGNVQLFGSFRSTLASGAPYPVTSTTECLNVDADLLDDHAWHAGLYQAGTVDSVGSSDVASTASVDLDKAGKWRIRAAGWCINYASGDQGRTWEARIKTSGGTQIGETAELTLSQWSAVEERSEQKTFLITGDYTAAGVTTVRVELVVVSGTGSANYCECKIEATWEGA